MFKPYKGEVRMQTIRIFFLSVSVAVVALSGFSVHAGNLDDCSKELLISYFPEPFVNEILAEYQISKDLWPQINSALQDQDKTIISTVEAKAAKMNPNPLKDPSQRNTAVAIFKETLYETFAKVMNQYGIDDKEQIAAMLDEIQFKKAKRFRECMEKQNSMEIQPVDNEESMEKGMTQSNPNADQ